MICMKIMRLFNRIFRKEVYFRERLLESIDKYSNICHIIWFGNRARQYLTKRRPCDLKREGNYFIFEIYVTCPIPGDYRDKVSDVIEHVEAEMGLSNLMTNFDFVLVSLNEDLRLRVAWIGEKRIQ